MNVTLRPDSPPDVWINTCGEAMNLAALERAIRTMQIARTWLIREIADGKVGTRKTITVAEPK
jgi:hypothetical protein